MLLDFDNVVRFPRLVEELDIGSVKADDRHEIPTLSRLDPVGVGHALRLRRAKKEIDRAILLLDCVLQAVLCGISCGVSGIVPSVKSVKYNGKSKIVPIEITEYSVVFVFLRNPSRSHPGNRNGNANCFFWIVELFLFSQRYDNFV